MRRARTSAAPRGFTLIELMIVVAIIAVIAAIAIPKFGEIVQRSRESSAKGALGTFRSALDIYYVANQGTFPQTTAALVAGTYIDFLPSIMLPPIAPQSNPGHIENDRVEDYADESLFGTMNEGVNVWAYVNAGTNLGHVGFNCTHRDSKGTVWSTN